MTNTRVDIRQAQDSDRPKLERFVRQTGGERNLRGDCFIAIAEDHIVGTVTLTRLDTQEWWLDDLCVLPDYRRQGIGRALHRYVVERAEMQGRGTLRLAVHTRQRVMHRLAVQSQFSLVGSYLSYQTDALPDYRPEFSAALDIVGVRAFLDGSLHYFHAERSMDDSGIWFRMTDARLQACAAQSRIYVWQGRRHAPNAPDGVIILAANSAPPMLSLAYLDASVGALADLCRAVRRWAGAQGYEHLQHRCLARPERLVAIEQAGWRPPEAGGEDRDVFSRPLGITQNRFTDL